MEKRGGDGDARSFLLGVVAHGDRGNHRMHTGEAATTTDDAHGGEMGSAARKHKCARCDHEGKGALRNAVASLRNEAEEKMRGATSAAPLDQGG